MGILFTEATLAGWDIAFDSSESQLNVGVLKPENLPADKLVYRYYFTFTPTDISGDAFNPLDSGGGVASLGGGAGAVAALAVGSDIRILRNTVEFTLDFISSDRFKEIYVISNNDTVDSETLTKFQSLNFDDFKTTNIINNNEISLNRSPLAVNYAFKLETNDEEEIKIKNRDGTISNKSVPETPKAGDRRSWVSYYERFERNGEFNDFDFFEGKALNPDKEFTKNFRSGQRTTDARTIKIKDLQEGDVIIVEYEGITERLYRQNVKIDFVKFNFLSGGVSLNGGDTPFVEGREVEHYIYKKWKDDEGNEHEGWRISEAWNNGSAFNKLENPNQPISLENSFQKSFSTAGDSDHILFNMNNDNLKLPDEDRVGYEKDAALGLIDIANDRDDDFSPEFAPNIGIPTNNISPDTVSSNNFEIEFVSRGVTYIGTGDVLVETGGALGIFFAANILSFTGLWESQVYRRDYPSNTRIVNVFGSNVVVGSAAASGSRPSIIGAVIAVNYLRKESPSAGAAQDPIHCFIVDNQLYFLIFNDEQHAIELSSSLNETFKERFENFSPQANLGATSKQFPGNTVFIPNFFYKTGIDDSNISTNVSPDSQKIQNDVKFTKVNIENFILENISNEVAEYNNINFPIDSSRFVSALKIKLNMDSDATFKIRGWSSEPNDKSKVIGENDQKPIREFSSVSIINNEENIISLESWNEVSFIELFTTTNIKDILSIEVFYLSEDATSFNVLNDVAEATATTDDKGNLMIFYVDNNGRLNYMSTKNNEDWFHVENVLIRGDTISNIKTIVNRESESLILFYFYKQALLMTIFDLDLINIQTDDPEKQTKVLDLIRRTSSQLIYGDIHSQNELRNNTLLTEEDFIRFHNRSNSAATIYSGQDTISNEHDLSEWNKFIKVGTSTYFRDLSSNFPFSRDYSVYQNINNIFRILIKEESGFYRCIQSFDRGIEWQDAWILNSEGQNGAIINNIFKEDEEVEEATNVFCLYNEFLDKLFILYFYRDAILCKIFSDYLFNENLEEVTKNFNSSSIYAVAGNLVNVQSFKETFNENNELIKGKIIFNKFQEDENNFNKFYSKSIYREQEITGHVTKKGYVKISILRDDNSFDGYIFNGIEWLPERIVLEE